MYVPQYEYMKMIADANIGLFKELGHAAAGHNGPYYQLDSPVRNSAYYLAIYSYLYRVTHENIYLDMCEMLYAYIRDVHKESFSGAIRCMDMNTSTYSFGPDRLNGLIGQAWVIDALLSYYEVSELPDVLEMAISITKSQKYDSSLHLWHRIDVSGEDLGIDRAYNHNVYFAASAARLLEHHYESSLDEEIRDFLSLGAERDFRVNMSGRLRHQVAIPIHANAWQRAWIIAKRLAKVALSPFKNLNPKKLDVAYQENGYQIFDMYGFKMLEKRYGNLPLFSSKKYRKAKAYALDLNSMNKRLGVKDGSRHLNEYGYLYNSPAFEYPYIAEIDSSDFAALNALIDVHRRYMLDQVTGQFSRNNPDIETFNARTFEIIRYLDAAGFTEKLING